MRAFWTSEFGLPECTDSLETHIEKNKNKNSASHDDGFACTSWRWHRVSALDAALGLCTGSKEGSFAKLDSAKEYYTCAMGVWQEISETAYNLKECTFDREGEYVSEGGEYFACVARQWKEIDSVSYELKICTHDRYGEYAKTKKGFYRCINSVWEEITEVDYTLKTCSSENAGEKATVEDDYYLCREGAWEKIDAVSYELGLCEESIEGTLDETKAYERYVCDKSEDSWAWRKLTESEAEFGICTQAKEGLAKESSSGDFVACSGRKWIEADETSANLGALCQETLENEVRWYGASVSFDDTEGVLEDPSQAYYFEQNVFPAKDAKFFECHNGKWETSTGIRWLYGANCAENIMNSYVSAEYDEQIGLHFNYSDSSFATVFTYAIIKTGTLATFGYDLLTNSEGDTLLYAICKNKDWEKISQGDYEQQEVCSESNLGKQSDGYKCTADGWKKLTKAELDLGECTSYLNDTYHAGYVCDYYDNNDWRSASAEERATGMVCSRTTEDTVVAGYVCAHFNDYTWRTATTAEKATGKVCRNILYESIINNYSCGEAGWRTASEAELATGMVCSRTRKDTVVAGYVCIVEGNRYTWRNATTAETATGELCGKNNLQKNGFSLQSHGYVCTESGWRRATTLEKQLGKVCTGSGYYKEKIIINSDTMYLCRNDTGLPEGWIRFATGDVFTEENGNSFKGILVGENMWMDRNVSYDAPKCYNDQDSNCVKYGGLYPKSVTDNSSHYCPSGWSIPIDDQIEELQKSDKRVPIPLTGYCKIESWTDSGDPKKWSCFKKGEQASFWLRPHNKDDDLINLLEINNSSWIFKESEVDSKGKYEKDVRYRALRCYI